MTTTSTQLTVADVINQANSVSAQPKVYTGIGSRQTPAHITPLLSQIAEHLATKGYTLRSGGAAGADSAFEAGCDRANGKKEIFLPWKGFNQNASPFFLDFHLQSPQATKAVAIATQFHPLKQGLLSAKPAVLKLMARNSQQVLGHNVCTTSKSSFVICWTPNGELTGGTRQALVIAQYYSVPIFNLGNLDTYIEIANWLQASSI